MAFGAAHCEAAAGTVNVLIVADVSRMTSLIIMGQLQYCRMLRNHLRLQQIYRANAFAGFGTCLFERHLRDEVCVFARCQVRLAITIRGKFVQEASVLVLCYAIAPTSATALISSPAAVRKADIQFRTCSPPIGAK
jgi:hypothetical protein